MLEIIFKSLCMVLLIYAVVTIITKFVDASKHHNKSYFVVLKIKDSNEQLECIVRSIIWKSLSLSGGGFIPNILIVDAGANEETIKIIKNLMKEYSFIFYITEKDFEKIKEKFII